MTGWEPIAVKKAWVPEFLWAFVSDLFGLGWKWPARALSEPTK